MSAVIHRTKQLYRKALSIEFTLFCVLTAGAALWHKADSVSSFFVGGMASFLPHCLFVYWVFFRKTSLTLNKMTDFYRGEGLKWLATIVLIVVLFKFYTSLNYVFFFIGYFLMLLLNSLLPILYRLRTK
ncbi:ATP synthase subunit I [Glaesserella sp.]|uniref:ATP synthase subunit I n=1 Tax=Glaesserella sp. TaxID=2094731 RepID=UPI0035A0CE8B